MKLERFINIMQIIKFRLNWIAIFKRVEIKKKKNGSCEFKNYTA